MTEKPYKNPEVLVDGKLVDAPGTNDPRDVFGEDPDFTVEDGVLTAAQPDEVTSPPIVTHEIGFAKHRDKRNSLGRIGIHSL